jgi:hypothetical protein
LKLEWRRCPLNEEYEVSNYGDIKRNGEIRKCKTNKDGYHTIIVKVGNAYKNFQCSRLVYMTFIGNIPLGYEVNHIDFNRKNNRVDNLEMLTHKENVRHSSRLGRYKTPNKVGQNHGRAVLDDMKVLAILTMPKNKINGRGGGVAHKDLAIAFKVSVTRIARIRSGREWKHIHRILNG